MTEIKNGKLKELIQDDKNMNKHNEYGMSLLEKSISKYGLGRSILVDKNNKIIAGNGVTETAANIGLDDVIIVPTNGRQLVVVQRTDLDLDSKEARELALADNAVAHVNLEWDEEQLQAVTEEWGIDWKEWGVDLPEFENVEEVEAQEDDFDVPEGGIETDIVLGDLFEIGEHRLLCGDSTDSDQVAKLMNGEKADIMVSDPPYGIDLDTDYSKMGATTTKYEKIKGDDKEFDLTDVISISGTKEQYIWGGDYFVNSLDWMSGTQIIWAKRHSEEENKVFGSAFESLWVSYKCKKLIWFIRPINQSSERLGKHPTQKPIECMSRCIEMSKLKGGVYDAFLGSGSTMVASHQLKRKCYGMELDPKYCQVIVDRMIKLDPTLEIKRNGELYIRK